MKVDIANRLEPQLTEGIANIIKAERKKDEDKEIKKLAKDELT